MVWARSETRQALAAGTQFSENLLEDFETAYGANLIGSTVIRIRGLITAQVTTVGSAVADSIRFGARVAAENETAALGGPVDLPHEDWMLWEPFTAHAVGNDGGHVGVARVIDNSAMRKMDEINQELTMFVESSTGAAWDFSWELSVLLKLP